MSLTENLAARLTESKPRTFKQWVAVADPDEVEVVMSYVRNAAIVPNTLMGVLRDNEVPITPKTIRAIRNGVEL